MNTPMRNAMALTIAILMASSAARAIDLADLPLFLTAPLSPNIIVTLDTSGSMEAAHTPDSLNTESATKRYKSSYYNPMYYNPEVVYPQPRKFDGTFAATTFSNAWINGFDPAKGSGNLNTHYVATRSYAMTSSGNTHNSGQTFAGGTNPFAVSTTGAPTAYSYSCNVSFDDRGSPGPDRININSGCLNAFANITTGTVLTVTGSSRAGTYTVTYSNDNRVTVGNPWPSDLNNQNVTLSWTKPGATTTDNPAYYYRYDATASGCDGTKTDEDCYVAVKVSATSGPATRDINGDGAINAADADEFQNFANWYSFYRVRTLAMVTSANVSFWDVSTDVRLAWQNLNTCNNFTGSSCAGRSGTNYPNYIKEFSGTHRDNFFKWLFDIKTASGTPLRIAAQRAGEYIKTPPSATNDPYAEFPQSSAGTLYSCRKNYHILMTDGEWNTTGESGLNTYGNLDGALAKPYYDNVSGSLADVIYYYWKNDLRSTLTDNVPTSYSERSNETFGSTTLIPDDNPRNDPANHQHLTTFTMGLGLTSSLTDPAWAGSTYAGGYGNVVSGVDTWTDSSSSTTKKIYDLWHGAINSRGEFFSTEDPAEMTLAFKRILSSIDANVSAASGLSTNSASIRTDSVLFQARFRPSEWAGELLAYSINTTGPNVGKLGAVTWDAGTKMASRNKNKIATWVPGSQGQVFDWSNLSVAQKALLNKDILGNTDTKGADRVDWLKGDTAKEIRFDTGSNTKTFRDRKTTVLGDIVNADLVYAHNEDFGYGSTAFGAKASEGASYNSFVSTTKAGRPSMVYAGANDGMLHGFTADKTTGGDELLAYIPNAIYGKLSALTDPGYTHQYYVDGPAVVADAYFSSDWKSVLVTGLGKGGKAVFALDVTDPVNFDPATDVLWEKASTDTDFTNLGYVYGKPKVVRIDSGWVAIFGNGYNSTSGAASLFIVNIADGSLVKEIVVDATGPDNGLSEPTLIDTDGDRIMDYAYAGDLKGNMWKFDLKTLTSPYTLFVAGSSQPITSAPTWGVSPDTGVGGAMIYFGTGQYLGQADLITTATQSFYGIWDKGAAVSKSDLQEQQILAEETNTAGLVLRKTSDTAIAWSGTGAKSGWYMDLGAGSGNAGERVIKKGVLSLGWLLFTTAIPKSDRCDAGGDSWFFMLDPLTGKRPYQASLDINGDGAFDTGDALPSDGTTAPSAAKSTIGILTPPLVIGHTSSASWDPLTEMTGGSGEAGATSVSTTGGMHLGGTGGTIQTTGIQCNGCTTPTPTPTPTPTSVNRVFWRQIQ